MSNNRPFLAQFARTLQPPQKQMPDSETKGHGKLPVTPPIPRTTITQVNAETTDED